MEVIIVTEKNECGNCMHAIGSSKAEYADYVICANRESGYYLEVKDKDEKCECNKYKGINGNII